MQPFNKRVKQEPSSSVAFGLNSKYNESVQPLTSTSSQTPSPSVSFKQVPLQSK